MILGMSVAAFTQLHVVISLIGVATGLIVVWGMMSAYKPPVTTALFLLTTVLTSVTGFMFPFTAFGPPEIVGVISLVALGVALLALYVFGLAGAWRWLYVVTSLTALWLNCFVAVAQTFAKVPFFNALAPHQTEPPFAIAQLIVLAAFIALGVAAVKKFHPAAVTPILAQGLERPKA